MTHPPIAHAGMDDETERPAYAIALEELQNIQPEQIDRITSSLVRRMGRALMHCVRHVRACVRMNVCVRARMRMCVRTCV